MKERIGGYHNLPCFRFVSTRIAGFHSPNDAYYLAKLQTFVPRLTEEYKSFLLTESTDTDKERMSALPPFRPTLPAAYSSPRGGQQKANQQSLRPDALGSADDATNQKRVSSDPSPRNRVLSSGAYEGLIFDRSPEETERMSRKVSNFIDKSSGKAFFAVWVWR